MIQNKTYLLLIIVFVVTWNSIAQNRDIVQDSLNDSQKITEEYGQLFIKKRFNLIRFRDDFSYLKNTEKTKLWEKLKYIPVGNFYLSIGGDARTELEFLRTDGLNLETSTDDYFWDQRLMAHVSLRGKRFRSFVQLNKSWRLNNELPQSPNDEDELALHQAFFDIKFDDRPEAQASYLRLGRQEFFVGSGRFFGIREGPNMRLSYDGISGRANINNFRGDFFYLREVAIREHIFDNEIFGDNTIYGAYGTYKYGNDKNGQSAELYYVGLERPLAFYQDLVGEDNRHTLGTRYVFRHRGQQGFDIDAEFNYQFGEFNNLDVSAYSFSLNADYFWKTVNEIEHRLGFKANLYSGDKDATDNKIGTFNPINPALGFLGRLVVFRWSNLAALHPSYRISFGDSFAINAENAFLWRPQKEDFLYAPSTLPYSAENRNGEESYVGMLPSIEAEWAVNAFLSFEIYYAALLKGNYFIDEENDIHNIAITTYFRF
ncbi:alginate export family protein [Aquimarina gracilis]|uniref:Alginate export family protein n=1 Tax=Aquimarina gracilis TaxID=874422 RepID=A0ABU5ZT33_9FLAO|nr:alginate export family protein [Aquimarina gracilis]MEB3345113.1 alginate export family protein [Aquimarina gracilis]